MEFVVEEGKKPHDQCSTLLLVRHTCFLFLVTMNFVLHSFKFYLQILLG